MRCDDMLSPSLIRVTLMAEMMKTRQLWTNRDEKLAKVAGTIETAKADDRARWKSLIH